MKALLDDWNYYLGIYLEYYCYTDKAPYIEENLFKKYNLKLYKYWWRLDCWNIPDMVDDNILIHHIHTLKQSTYK